MDRLAAQPAVPPVLEDRIKAAKDSGLGRFPSRQYTINEAWLQIVAVAADLTAWLRLLALDGDLAAAEPKALRFRMLQVRARLVRSTRRADTSGCPAASRGPTKSSRHSDGS